MEENNHKSNLGDYIRKLIKEEVMMFRECPGILGQANRINEERAVHCIPVDQEEKVWFTALPGQLIREIGMFFRMLVRATDGAMYWLVVCGINKTGFLLPLDSFDGAIKSA